MAIACTGYRVTGKTGHHKITLECIRLALGTTAATYADYLETCRRKRNLIDYTHSHVATETEAKEILKTAREFCEMVEAWHPKTPPGTQTAKLSLCLCARLAPRQRLCLYLPQHLIHRVDVHQPEAAVDRRQHALRGKLRRNSATFSVPAR